MMKTHLAGPTSVSLGAGADAGEDILACKHAADRAEFSECLVLSGREARECCVSSSPREASPPSLPSVSRNSNQTESKISLPTQFPRLLGTRRQTTPKTK